MKPPIFFLVFLFFILGSKAQNLETSQKVRVKNVELFILQNKLDSAAIFLRQVKKNNYIEILSKIKNRESLTYLEYDEFTGAVSQRQSINYLLVSNFINEFVKDPTDSKKNNTDYVHIKWSQIGCLRSR